MEKLPKLLKRPPLLRERLILSASIESQANFPIYYCGNEYCGHDTKEEAQRCWNAGVDAREYLAWEKERVDRANRLFGYGIQRVEMRS